MLMLNLPRPTFQVKLNLYVPEDDNPNEFAYSSDKPGVAQPNRAQRGETEDQEGGAGQEGGVDEVPTVYTR